MRLCRWQGQVTSDLVELPPKGTPYLVDSHGRELAAPNDYLLYIAQHRGRTRSPLTWETYGRHLYDFFSFLEVNKLHWDRPQRPGKPSVVSLYREWAIGRRERGTVNDHLGTIVRFYAWALDKALIQQLPYNIENIAIPTSDLAFVPDQNSEHKKSADVMLRDFEKPLEVLNVEEAIKLVLIFNNNSTHRLMTRLGLATGIRVSELLTFPIAYIFNPDERDKTGRQKHFRVRLDPNEMAIKYNKGRDIYITRRLMRDLWNYVVTDRYVRGGLVAKDHKDTKLLFVTEKGTAFHEKSYNAILRKAGQKIGRHVYPHMLRHTYATHTLLSLSERHNTGFALKWVQERLGHSSVNTTMRYLHLLGEVHSHDLDTYQSELDAIMDAEVALAS